MYTQCPDCEIAFKITADVLRQAAGKVRCGGCGNAFNALSYLSEKMPKQPVAKEANAAVPELRPEIIETDAGPPHSISAEQSAALLKTLDELAGSDIRIEDTGVEWRVLDEQEAAAPAADDDNARPSTSTDFSTKNVDEYLDDAETPIDEFLTATPEVIDSPEIFSEEANGPAQTHVNELRFDDNTPLPDDFDLDDESSYVAVSEPVFEPVDVDDEQEPVVEKSQPEIALSEPNEWQDILGEFQDLAEEVAAPIEGLDPEFDTEDVSDEEPVVDLSAVATDESISDEPLDMDTQFALQAEAMGIDLSGTNELDIDEDKVADEVIVDEPEEDPKEELDEVIANELDDEDEIEDLEEEDLEEESEPEFDDEIEQLNLIGEQGELIEEPIIESHTIEEELAADDASGGADDASDDVDSGEHVVPPMTEEEHTVNMQIDEDLMALAIEDEDGFASTIVIPKKDTEKKGREEKASMAPDGDDVAGDSDDMSGFETIIMEGEFIRSAMDSDKLAADAAAASELAEIARAREAEQANQSGGMRYGIIAGVVLLVLTLAAQMIHQSREALATIPAFSNTVGQLYRVVGQPVQPAWDITGWRFEATKGSAEGEEEELTIYSRLGNNSDDALPYPLIGISLTDRFEETIGSRVLDPAEYLPSDLDPRKLVEPGNTFNAVITIKSTSEDATGFKLNVCYRLSDGQLRCAIDDFK
jgi:predicted Zn finger-like uncharacterized protein